MLRYLTDIKVTSITQPQSSCPFKNARQKIFGLGYHLLVFVYEKTDTQNHCTLHFTHCTFIKKDRTADFTITKRLREMIDDGANKEDIIGFLQDKNVPGDDIVYHNLADDILSHKPKQGYLTISNALQWRLRYERVIALNNTVKGVTNYEWQTGIELHPKSWTPDTNFGRCIFMGTEIYSYELKQEVVKYVLEGHSHKEAAERFGVTLYPVEKWVNLYKRHGERGLESRAGTGRKH